MTSPDFLTDLRRGLKRCRLADCAVLIGVSGGADSVALFRGLLELRNDFGLSLRVAHLNHQLRGADSDGDADWVRRLAETYAVPIDIGIVNLAVNPDGAGVEEAARNARHPFLDTTARSSNCQAIATAHTADDQAETVLHHIFRGTGLSGLRGIPRERQTTQSLAYASGYRDAGASGNRNVDVSRHGSEVSGDGSLACRLVRPMLSIRRQTIERYLQEIGQDFRTDHTNSDTRLTRNWLRHQLLPLLRQQFGSHVDTSLTRLAEQASEVESAMILLAERLLETALLDVQQDVVRVDSGKLSGQPIHLIRESFRVLWQRQRWPRQAMGHVEWNRLAEIALNGGSANLPGNIIARNQLPLLVLEKQIGKR